MLPRWPVPDPSADPPPDDNDEQRDDVDIHAADKIGNDGEVAELLDAARVYLYLHSRACSYGAGARRPGSPRRRCAAWLSRKYSRRGGEGDHPAEMATSNALPSTSCALSVP